MSKKMSTLFHEFIHDNDLNGNDEIIRETNAVVAEDDIEVGTMLDDQVGEKYFYKCMELAENVIKSFEDEQPELNENQHVVLDCLKKHFSNKETKNYPVTAIFSIFTENTEEFSDVELAYSELTMKQEAQVLLAFANWVLEQEEEE